MKRYILFIATLAFSLIGCKQNKPESKPSLTTDELLQLMGGELFEITVPDSIQEDQHAGLAIRCSDGSIKPMGSSTGWLPGEVVKFVCFTNDENRYKYSYLREKADGRGSMMLPEHRGMNTINTKRTGLVEGEMLMRFSKDAVIVGGDLPEGDDFDIIFHVQKKNK